MNAKKSIPDRLMRFTFLIATGWVICFWPARMLRPEHGVFWMSVAALACLIPGWTIVLSERLAIFRQDAGLILGQMSIRVAGLVSVAVFVRAFRPELGLVDFYAWLLVFYVVALCYELVLLRELFSSRSQPVGSAENQTSS